METRMLIEKFCDGAFDNQLLDIYGDVKKIEYQRMRYINTIQAFQKIYGEGEIAVFSAPGRSEIGGNHTDHQCGEVLATAINLDAIGVVMPTSDNCVRVTSDGYKEIVVSIDDLEQKSADKGTSEALIKGILFGMRERGYQIGGFCAYITSDVLIGAGLSSSAAFETLLGTIVSGLFNDMIIAPAEIAIVGQYAENIYFGKPCGLMDQIACSVGGLVHVDFANPQKPNIEQIDFEMSKCGYSLCITDTKGSHSDLTADYAAIPVEMKMVANFFGREIMLGVTAEDIISEIDSLRRLAGDRAVLRAVHFIAENQRVREEVKALEEGNLEQFFRIVKESGNSSYKYLQNVYSANDITHQNLSLALAVSDMFLGAHGVSRVHGGGFAGTIQAFIRNIDVEAYQKCMDTVFGAGSCVELKIRKHGGMKVV